MLGLLGSPAFAQKAVFKAQTERKVSQWENKLKENTETQVWEVCLFSPARRAARNEAGGWESLSARSPRPGSGTVLHWAPGSALALAPSEYRFSKCGPRTGASP